MKELDPEYQELRRQNYVAAKQLAAPVIDDEDRERHLLGGELNGPAKKRATNAAFLGQDVLAERILEKER